MEADGASTENAEPLLLPKHTVLLLLAEMDGGAASTLSSHTTRSATVPAEQDQTIAVRENQSSSSAVKPRIRTSPTPPPLPPRRRLRSASHGVSRDERQPGSSLTPPPFSVLHHKIEAKLETQARLERALEETKSLRHRNQFLEDLVRGLRSDIEELRARADPAVAARKKRTRAATDQGASGVHGHAVSKRAWEKKMYHRKQQSLSWNKAHEQPIIDGAPFTRQRSDNETKVIPQLTAAPQPFSDLVYQWHDVQKQIDAGVHMVKRAKKYMAKLASLHRRFATELVKAATEESEKIHSMRPGDRMNSCRDAFQMILSQSEKMAAAHTQFAESTRTTVITPLSAFYQVGNEISDTIAQVKERATRSLGQRLAAVRKSARVTQHLIDECVRTDVGARTGLLKKLLHRKPNPEARLLDLKRVRQRAVRATREHEALCKAVSLDQRQYLEVDMPGALSQMQTIEEMRVESFRKQILSYSRIIEQFSDAFLRIASDVNQFGGLIRRDADIQNFAANCAQNTKLQLPDVQYALSKRPEDLDKGEDDAAAPTSSGAQVFGNDIKSIMEGQSQRPELRSLRVPCVVKRLVDAVRDLGGLTTLGIFRVSAAQRELNSLQERLSKNPEFEFPSDMSPHVPAGLLKLFLRRLRDPLIPDALYPACVGLGRIALQADGETGKKKGKTVIFDELRRIMSKIPKANAAVIEHLVEMASVISSPDNVTRTKMGVSNLAVVFAPSLLRNPSTDPLDMIANIKFEIRFVDTLLGHLAAPRKK